MEAIHGLEAGMARALQSVAAVSVDDNYFWVRDRLVINKKKFMFSRTEYPHKRGTEASL